VSSKYRKISVVFPPGDYELKEWVESQSEQDGRTASNWLLKVLKERRRAVEAEAEANCLRDHPPADHPDEPDDGLSGPGDAGPLQGAGGLQQVTYRKSRRGRHGSKHSGGNAGRKD